LTAVHLGFGIRVPPSGLALQSHGGNLVRVAGVRAPNDCY
jgi:hypothetical protein